MQRASKDPVCPLVWSEVSLMMGFVNKQSIKPLLQAVPTEHPREHHCSHPQPSIRMPAQRKRS